VSYITLLPLVDTSVGLPGMKEQKFIHEGLITESLPNDMRVGKNSTCRV